MECGFKELFQIYIYIYMTFSEIMIMAESEGTNKLVDESERGEWKSWLKAQHSENGDHGIWSHHFMANR